MAGMRFQAASNIRIVVLPAGAQRPRVHSFPGQIRSGPGLPVGKQVDDLDVGFQFPGFPGTHRSFVGLLVEIVE